MMQMGFVERFPAGFGGLEKRQRLTFSPSENFQGPEGTDANSRANVGEQRQYQGPETDTEQALRTRSLHRLRWELPPMLLTRSVLFNYRSRKSTHVTIGRRKELFDP